MLAPEEEALAQVDRLARRDGIVRVRSERTALVDARTSRYLAAILVAHPDPHRCRRHRRRLWVTKQHRDSGTSFTPATSPSSHIRETATHLDRRAAR
jgi:hypothetical protein